MSFVCAAQLNKQVQV